MTSILSYEDAFAIVHSQDVVRLDAHRREARRYSGVSMSGMGPDRLEPLTAAQLDQRARDKVADHERFSQTHRYQALAALAAGQQLCVSAHASFEDVRNALARNDGTHTATAERAAELIRDLRLKASDMEQHLKLMGEDL